MKSANLYSSPSKAWYKENFRRFWVLPLIEFLALFLVNILPIMLNYGRFECIYDYASTSLWGYNIANIVLLCSMAIVVSTAVFSYIHGVASATIVHSMPITRRELFRGSFFSGLVMLIIPLILTGILFLCMSGAHISADALKTICGTSEYNIITIKAICIWVFESSVIVAFVYTMANLAGILAGSRLIHVLLALFINGLPFVLLEIFYLYEDNFFFGYPEDESPFAFSFVSPVSYMASKFGRPEIAELYPHLIYIAVIIAVALFTSWLYTRIKLERERNACVFPAVADIICVLLTFICMSLLGLLIASSVSDIDNGLIQRIPFIIVCIASSVFIYMICRMIADGTTKIFSKVNLKKFGIYVIVVAVFFAFTLFDITGYQQRVPEASKVASVTLETNYAVQPSIDLKSGKSIDSIISLQKALLSEYKNQGFGQVSSDDLTIRYQLKNGRTLSRSYSLPVYNGKHGNIKTTEAFKNIFNSAEFSRANLYNTSASAIKSIAELKFTNTYSKNKDYEESEETVIASKDYYGLLKAMNKDILTMDFNDFSTIVNNDYDYPSVDLRLNSRKSMDESSFYLNKSTKNTIKYLKATGYWEQ